MKNRKKHVIIVGAGVAGLTAGIYCLQQGFSVDLYEKNPMVGGQCVCWKRNGISIDGCAHWVIGTSKDNDLYPLWKNVGVIDDSIKCFKMDVLSDFKVGDKVLHYYSDIDKWKEEMLSFFPEDRKIINEYVAGVKAYTHVKIPVRKPLGRMNLWNLMMFGIPMLPMAKAYAKYTKVSVEEFAAKAKNPVLGEILLRWFPGNYNMHSFFYVHQSASQGDCCVFEGGSIGMTARMQKRFESLGGSLHLSSPVKRVLIDAGLASGIELEDGNCVFGDDVIVATDSHHAMYDLLEGKFDEKFYSKRFADNKKFPLNTGLLASFRIHKDMSEFPKMYDFPVDVAWEGEAWKHIAIRNYSFDKTFVTKKGSLLSTLMLCSNDLYGRLKAMGKKTYLEAKKTLLGALQEIIAKELGIGKEDVEPLDLTTPLTYERYCNAYRGSYMSFITTKHMGSLMHSGTVKGVSNLFLAGQWIMPPGGLPVALFTGQNAAWNVTKFERLRYLDPHAIKAKIKKKLHP